MIIRTKFEDYASPEEKNKFFELYKDEPDAKQTFGLFFKVQHELPHEELSYYLDEANGYTYESFKELLNETIQNKKAAEREAKAAAGPQKSQGQINKEKFVAFYGEDYYNDFVNFKDTDYLDEKYKDINYWINFIKGISPEEIAELKKQYRRYVLEFEDAIYDAKDRKEEHDNFHPVAAVEEETEEEKEIKEAEAQKNSEANNTSKIIEGEGIEYLGGDANWRVYKVTSPEGSAKFALPRSQGKGWCITGGGTWGRGDATKGITDVGTARNYWCSSYAPFYFFMTEPMNKSWAFYKSGSTWSWVDARTDSHIQISPDVPLWLPFLPEGLKALSKAKPEIFEEFTILNGTLTQINDKSKEEYLIPAAVQTIGNAAFKGCNKMKKVILQAPTRYINYRAFQGCSNLEKVEIRGSLLTVDFEAFEGCSSLKAINISDLQYIAKGCFKNCNNLVGVKMSKSLNSIGPEAFMGCVSLGTIYINSECHIADTAFKYCTNLTIITNARTIPANWSYTAENVKGFKFKASDSINEDFEIIFDEDTLFNFDDNLTAKEVKCLIKKNGEEPEPATIKEITLEVSDDNGDKDKDSIVMPHRIIVHFKGDNRELLYDGIYDGYDTYYEIKNLEL